VKEEVLAELEAPHREKRQNEKKDKNLIHDEEKQDRDPTWSAKLSLRWTKAA
jgi:hypothetical protein